MAFGLWLKGHISGKPILDLLAEFENGTDAQGFIVPSPYKLANGDDAFDVKYREVAKMLTRGFFSSLAFWKDYKKYSALGMFARDFRALTVQQKKVIDIYDDCLALHQKDSVPPRPAEMGRGL